MSSVSCLFMSTTRISNRISLKLYQGKMHFFWTSRSFTFHARLGIAIIKHDTNGIKRVIEKDVSQSHIYYWKKKKKTELNNNPTNCSTRIHIWFYWEFSVRFQLAFAQRGAISTAYPYDNVLTANLTWLSLKWAYYSKFLGKISHRFWPHRRWVVLVLIRSSDKM